MVWEKGKSGNANGRPPKAESYIGRLEKEIKKVEKAKGKKLIQHAIERAYVDDGVLVSILRKIMPDLSAQKIEADIKEYNPMILIRHNNDDTKILEAEVVNQQLPDKSINSESAKMIDNDNSSNNGNIDNDNNTLNNQ
jgi:hypothetical protein